MYGSRSSEVPTGFSYTDFTLLDSSRVYTVSGSIVIMDDYAPEQNTQFLPNVKYEYYKLGG